MAGIHRFLSQRDLQKVSNLRVFARQVVEGFCSGLHVSPHKGFSVEFREHRQYVPGDEIRHLDWKVYGKTDRFYIREYEEETNVRAMLVLDTSGSMVYGDGASNKLDYARRLTALLAYLMVRQQDAVGLATFDAALNTFIPARARPGHLQVLMDALEAAGPGRETEVGDVLHSLAAKLNRRGLVVIVSDCFGDVPRLMKALSHLRFRRHEVVIFQVWNRDELDFPFRRWTRFESLEAEALEHTLDPVQIRRAYLENLDRFRNELTQGCRSRRIDLVPLVTDQPFADALARYLSLRQRT